MSFWPGLAVAGLGAIVSGVGVAGLPGRDDVQTFVDRVNRTQPAPVLRVELGILPVRDGAGVAIRGAL